MAADHTTSEITRAKAPRALTPLTLERIQLFLPERREGLSDKQIAARHGVSNFTVMNTFHQARAHGLKVPSRMVYSRGTLAERFAQKVDTETGPVHPELGRCHVWKASLASHGYPYIRDTAGELGRKGMWQRAHRVAYALHHGVRIEAGSELVMRHKCDTPACVNVAHLELGTQKENIADAVSRGRMVWQQGRTAEETVAQRARAEKRRAAKLRKEQAAA